MSLLLDALRSTVPDVGPAPESEEELLDAHATLKLLAPKPVQSLSLEPTLEFTAASSTDFAPDSIAGAGPFPAPQPATAGVAEPVNGATALGAPNANAPLSAQAPVNTRTGAEAAPAALPSPQPMPRLKKYGLLLGALAALAGLGWVAHSFWPFGSSTVMYPERRLPQQSPANADPAPAPIPTTDAVQVPSERPADQFAYAGNAPEIDLRDSEVHAAASSPPATVTPLKDTDPAAGSKASAGSATNHRPASILSVARAQGPSSIDRHVDAGYRALAAGNVAIAQDEYSAALELDPNNVDALLGTATVAARDGRSTAAAAAYAGVLKLEPGNPDAVAAMAMLGSDGAAGESNESRLKILIAGDDGGRAALHAALGGIYAADGRWPEAAQEYFVALGKDPGNPDLAFNVAASLDQNRNFAAALIYYRQALAFARQRPAQLDTNAIERRIGQLQTREVHAPRALEAR